MYSCPCVIFSSKGSKTYFSSSSSSSFWATLYTLVCFLASPTPTAIPTMTHRPEEDKFGVSVVVFFFLRSKAPIGSIMRFLEHLVTRNTQQWCRKQTILNHFLFVHFFSPHTLPICQIFSSVPCDLCVLQLLRKYFCSSLCYNWLDRDRIFIWRF